MGANEVYGVGSDSSRCTSEAQDWQETFTEELLLVLVSTGQLERRGSSQYVWTASFVDAVNFLGAGRFYVSSEGLDVSRWLDTSVESNICDAIPYFDTLMGTSLCDTTTSLQNSWGSLEVLCPEACGLCETTGSDTRLVLLRLFEKQGEDLASGLIDFAIF